MHYVSTVSRCPKLTAKGEANFEYRYLLACLSETPEVPCLLSYKLSSREPPTQARSLAAMVLEAFLAPEPQLLGDRGSDTVVRKMLLELLLCGLSDWLPNHGAGQQ